MITQAAGRLYYYNLYRYRSWKCGWRAICLKHIEARRRDLQARKCLGWIKLESITFKVGIYQNQPNGPSGGFRTTPRALAKFGRPKNACVFEGGRIWLSPHGRARLRAQLARAKPGGCHEVGRRSAYALVIRRGRDSCLICKEIIIKQEEVCNGLLNEWLNVFPTAVWAPSERAVGRKKF